MRVVIAPDKFKGSLSADGVAEAVAGGLQAAGSCTIDLVPMADGGDGTLDAAVRAGFSESTRRVTGPDGSPVDATLAIDAGTAVVELATASGLALLPPDGLLPLTATSRGTGELIRAALDAGCSRIVLGVGGSACTDGGAGLMAALGARLLDAAGSPVPDGGGALADVARIDLSALDVRIRTTEFVVALDVDNPLLGDTGAAHTFGPQKGADPQQVLQLDSALANFARVLGIAQEHDLRDAIETPGAGAAGGVGFAALTVLGASPETGLELVADLVDLRGRVRGADLVITGEGSLDRQSLGGKTPVGVARIARAVGVPAVVAVCGVSSLSPDEERAAGFDAVWTLAELEPDINRSIADAAPLLTTIGERIGQWTRTAAPSEDITSEPAPEEA